MPQAAITPVMPLASPLTGSPPFDLGVPGFLAEYLEYTLDGNGKMRSAESIVGASTQRAFADSIFISRYQPTKNTAGSSGRSYLRVRGRA